MIWHQLIKTPFKGLTEPHQLKVAVILCRSPVAKLLGCGISLCPQWVKNLKCLAWLRRSLSVCPCPALWVLPFRLVLSCSKLILFFKSVLIQGLDHCGVRMMWWCSVKQEVAIPSSKVCCYHLATGNINIGGLQKSTLLVRCVFSVHKWNWRFSKN